MYSIISVEPEELDDMMAKREIDMTDGMVVKFTDGVRTMTCNVRSIYPVSRMRERKIDDEYAVHFDFTLIPKKME